MIGCDGAAVGVLASERGFVMVRHVVSFPMIREEHLLRSNTGVYSINMQ